MKQKNECKLIKKLLENYSNDIKNITINKFIENHIKECDYCKIKSQNEIQEKRINNQDKKNKNLKRRKTIILYLSIIIITLVLIITIGIVSINTSNQFTSELNFSEKIKYIANNKKEQTRIENILIESSMNDKNSISGILKYKIIATFNEKDRCIGIRREIDGYTKEKLNEQYNYINNNNSQVLSNATIIDGKLISDFNISIGKSKKEIMEDMKKLFSNINVSIF